MTPVDPLSKFAYKIPATADVGILVGGLSSPATMRDNLLVLHSDRENFLEFLYRQLPMNGAPDGVITPSPSPPHSLHPSLPSLHSLISPFDGSFSPWNIPLVLPLLHINRQEGGLWWVYLSSPSDNLRVFVAFGVD